MKPILFAMAVVFSLYSFAEEQDSQDGNQPAGVIASDYDLADAKKEDALDVHKAVEEYLDAHPECAKERICEKVYFLKEKSEKCGSGFKLADSAGWNLNAVKIKARTYEHSPAQGSVKPPGQGSHKAYGFGVCHKF